MEQERRTLSTAYAGLRLSSPLIIASGPASHDVNQLALAEQHGAGAVVLKTACSDSYAHMRRWPRPRYKLLDWDRQIKGRSKYFTLYSYEQGYSGTLEDYWEFIRSGKSRCKIPIVGSIFAGEAAEWAAMAVMVQKSGADAIELDISSPHRPGSLAFETAFVAAIKGVVGAVTIPVWVKLGPGPAVVDQAMAAEQCGAAGLTLCNRLRGIDVDLESQQPILHGYFAGVGGPWARYYTMLHVAEAAQAVRIPISATGGIVSGDDVLKFILLGASTAQVLSAIMVNGWEALGTMNGQILAHMELKGVHALEQLRKKALERLTDPEEITRWSGEPAGGGPRNAWK